MTREDRRHVILSPLATWFGILVLVALSAGYAYLPGAPVKLIAALAILLAQIALILMFFMQMRRADALVRLAAMAGVIWVSFLFLFSFADFLTRY